MTGSHAFRLVRDTGYNYLGAMVSGVVALLVLPVMVRLAGAELFGFWLALLALSRGVSAVELGLSSGVTRAVAAARQPRNVHADIRPFVASAFWTVIGFGIIGGAIVGALSFGIGRSWGIAATLPVLTIAILVGALTLLEQVTNYSNWVLFGARRFAAANAVTAGLSLMRSIGGVAVLYAGFGIEGLAWWFAGTAAAGAIVTQVVVRALEPRFRLEPGRFDWETLRANALFSLGSQGIVITTGLVVDTIPVLIIGAIVGPAAIVVYHLGQRLAAVLGRLFIAAGSVLFTSASEEMDDTGRMRSVLRAGNRWMVFLGLPACAILLLLAPAIVQVWLARPAEDVVLVFRLLVLTRLFTALADPSLAALWVTSIGTVLRVTLALFIPEVVLTWVLVSAFGAPGAALAALIGVATTTVLLVERAGRRFEVPLRRMLGDAFAGTMLPIMASGAVLGLSLLALGAATWTRLIAAAAGSLTVFLLLFYFRGMSGAEREAVRSLARSVRVGRRGTSGFDAAARP